jgi:hypothetical protein
MPGPPHFYTPSYFPELDVPQPGDSEWRSLQKWLSLLNVSKGIKAMEYPEGTAVQVGDDEDRLLRKINKSLS